MADWLVFIAIAGVVASILWAYVWPRVRVWLKTWRRP